MGDAPHQATVVLTNFVLTGGDDAFKSFRRCLSTLSYTPRKQRCALFKFELVKVLWRKQVLARNSRFKFVKNDASVVCVLWLQAFWYTLIPCKYKVQLISGANAQFMTPSIIKRGLILPLRSAGVSSDCGRRWSNSWWFPGPGTGLRRPGSSAPAGWGSAAGPRPRARTRGTRRGWGRNSQQRSAQDPWFDLWRIELKNRETNVKTQKWGNFTAFPRIP